MLMKIREEPFDIDKKRKNWVFKVTVNENKVANTLVESSDMQFMTTIG